MEIVALSILSGFEVSDIDALVDCGLLPVPHPKDGYLSVHVLRLKLIERARELNFTAGELMLLLDYLKRK